MLLDGGSWKPGLDRLLAVVDHAVLSADFALPDGREPDDLLDRVAALGPRHGRPVGRRRSGARPRRGRADGSVVVVPHRPARSCEVVDTLGAGDVLHGATAAALAGGQAILAALAEGVRRASESVRWPGALGWVRARDGAEAA